MLLRALFAGAILLAALAPTSSFVSEKTCREHTKLVGKCFKVHGRLSVYNGAPALRLFNPGTRRVLGISEQRFVVDGYRNVREEIKTNIDSATPQPRQLQ